MAILRLENGTIYTEISAIGQAALTEIEQQLSSLQIEIGQLPLEKYLPQPSLSKSLQDLFQLDSLNLSQKQEILQLLSPKATTRNYFGICTHCDLIVANLASPSLYQLLAQGSRPHVHSQDQVLYVLSGECILGFSHPDGYLIELMLRAQEYIKVPAGVRHWFSLSASLDLKAIRYFTHMSKDSPKKSHDEFHYSGYCRSGD
jgi:1,2-dihydroxy-3-keto-5-methylthiopentene dioxygenase